MKLLISTNSMDGTADALVSVAAERGLEVFRWNIDLWRHYDLRVHGTGFVLEDPTGRTVDASSDDVLMIWRKPFTEYMDFEDQSLESIDCAHARTQMDVYLQSLVALLRTRGLVRLVEPFADRRLPKLHQLYLARDLFAVPKFLFSIRGDPADLGPEVVTKPLGDPGLGGNRMLYTRRVDPARLCRPFPWFQQRALIGGQDVTCVHISGKSHFYVCAYPRGKESIDWRVEINGDNPPAWSKLEHPAIVKWEEAVGAFMRRAGLHYGRLDFILIDNELYFLECNSNGQFGWLDDLETLTLHREFLDAVCSPHCAVV
jgi:hypothetical protein